MEVIKTIKDIERIWEMAFFDHLSALKNSKTEAEKNELANWLRGYVCALFMVDAIRGDEFIELEDCIAAAYKEGV